MKVIRSICLAGVLLLGGCAIGNTVDFQSQKPDIAVSTDKDVVVAVLDQRAYVLDGDKGPEFVGLRRGGFGNPFDVDTRSGAPLADDMAAIIVEAMEAKGISARAISVPASNNPRTVIDAATAAGGDRALVLLVAEWKSDLYFAMEVDYNLVANVYDGAGNQLAQNEEIGKDTLGAVTFESELSAAGSAALKRKLEDLLNDPAIVTALQ